MELNTLPFPQTSPCMNLCSRAKSHHNDFLHRNCLPSQQWQAALAARANRLIGTMSSCWLYTLNKCIYMQVKIKTLAQSFKLFPDLWARANQRRNWRMLCKPHLTAIYFLCTFSPLRRSEWCENRTHSTNTTCETFNVSICPRKPWLSFSSSTVKKCEGRNWRSYPDSMMNSNKTKEMWTGKQKLTSEETF